MLKTYLTMAWRNLRKNRLYSVINISGLAVGMAVTLLIGLWVWDEVSANHAFANHKTLADIVSVNVENGTPHAKEYASIPMCAELKRRFPGEIKDAVMVGFPPSLIANGDKKISSWGFWTQQGFPDMFSLKMLTGSREALADPYAILLSRSTAKALFGQGDPMNRVVRVGDRTDMRVKGVYEEIPENTRFGGLGLLLAWGNKDNPADSLKDDWYDHHFALYVQVNETTDMALLSSQIKDLSKPYIRGHAEDLLLHPMDRWNLYDQYENGKMVAGRAVFVRLFGLIGLFVLLLACINFMNLSTARSEHRAKEVGIRKTIGSLRRQLVVQFLTESFLFVVLALVLSLLLAWLLLPTFNLLARKQLDIPIGSLSFWLLLAAFTLVTTLLAGSYPAFYLSSFRPVKVLKGVFKAGRYASLPRKILVVTQFTVSVSLIIGAIVIFRQLQYSRDRPVGYERAGLITVEMNSPALQDHFEALKDALLGTGAVDAVAKSSSPPTAVQNAMLRYTWRGMDPTAHPIIGTVFVSADYGKVLNWKIKEGRDFIAGAPADSNAIIINEAAARYIGYDHAAGDYIRWHENPVKIVGVVNDMVIESPYERPEPTFFMLNPHAIHLIDIRMRSNMPIRTALAAVEGVFQQFNPGNPFDYRFTDEQYATKFADEEQLGKMVSLFTLLAVLISCLGLWGLAENFVGTASPRSSSFVTFASLGYVAEQRTKEIGVRKILGASVVDLWKLLSGEFARLVLLSCALAIPLAWYFSWRWLEGFAYHAPLSWWLFAAAAIGALLITLLTVSYQAIRAARANPVKSLK